MIEIHDIATERADYRAAIVARLIRGALGERRPALWKEFPEHKRNGRSKAGDVRAMLAESKQIARAARKR